MRHTWTKKEVVENISKMHESGARLSSEYIKNNNVPLYGAALVHCGGWKKAIKAAGINWDDVRAQGPHYQLWSKKLVLKKIKEMHKAGKPLNSNYIQTKEVKLYRAAYSYFGGWAQAIKAAGLDYSKLRRKAPMRSWSKVAIVEEILHREKNGLTIRGGDMEKEDRGLYQAARRHFGKKAWARARVLAGLNPIDPNPKIIWTPETVVSEIQLLHENGVALNPGSLRRSEYDYIRPASCKVFGSLRKAVRAAGLDYSKIQKARMKGWWTKPRIIMCIKSLDKRGIRLSHNDIRKSHGALLGIAVHYFGSWSEAVETAGISYRAHSRTWSTTAWLKRLPDAEYQSILSGAKTHARKRRRA